MHPRQDGHGAPGNVEILMTQAEGFADPHAGIEQQGKQQPIPQMLTRVENRLNLLRRQDFRSHVRRVQLDRSMPLGPALGHVVQKRLVGRRRSAASARR